MRGVQWLLWMAVWDFKEINCGSFLIQNWVQMKELQTPTSACKFGNIRDSLLIDRMGCGMSDPTWLKRLLRGRFHPAEMHLNIKDSKTVWEKAPSNDNHWFTTNTVKQKVKEKAKAEADWPREPMTSLCIGGRNTKAERKFPQKGSHGREWTKQAEYVAAQN